MAAPQIFFQQDIKSVISRPEFDVHALLAAIEDGFKALSKGTCEVAPVTHLEFSAGSSCDACIKSGFIKGPNSGDHFVVKIATGGFSLNAAKGLPTADGIMILANKSTGLIDGLLLDGGVLTDLRTAAAGAVAAKWLAPTHISAIGVLGTGIQARLQIKLLAHVTKCRRVYVWGRNSENARQTCADIEAFGLGFRANVALSPRDVAQMCRLIVTTTSASESLLCFNDLLPGTHINCIGADGIGKQELNPDIVAQAHILVADHKKQCLEFGELSHAISQGLVDANAVVEIGNLQHFPNYRRHEEGDERISIFDSTGVAVQDIVIAELVFGALDSRRRSRL